jgi:uroporphyrinogen decarboxylase
VRLGVDAAIIFADLLLPLTPMGLDFEFVANEGPQIHAPIRTAAQARALRTDRTQDLLYVARAIEKVAAHFAAKGASSSSAVGANALKGTGFSPSVAPLPSKGAGSPGLQPRVSPDGISSAQDQLGIIGFCGAPFTLASYMIEGGSSRNYIETKKMMYASTSSLTQQSCHPERSAAESKDLRSPATDSSQQSCHPERSAAESKDLRSPATDSSPESDAWPILMSKLVTVLTDYAAQQVEAGADVIQVFDSWVGALSPSDYGEYALAPTTALIRNIQALGVPVIYFGVETSTLLPLMRHTGADVLGLDWRTPLDRTWRELDFSVAVQGNLDPITLFAPEKVLEARVAEVLAAAAGRPGHIFNLGHGIVPTTPVDAVLQVVQQVKRSA